MDTEYPKLLSEKKIDEWIVETYTIPSGLTIQDFRKRSGVLEQAFKSPVYITLNNYQLRIRRKG